MKKFIEFLYFPVYDSTTANEYWHIEMHQSGLTFGFWTVLICAIAIAVFFYFLWTNIKVFKHATLSSWFKIGLLGWLITFIATEVVIAKRSQLEGFDAYIGESGADILLFSIYNALVIFSIFYLIISTILQSLSRNAKNIPWKFFKLGAQG